MSERFAPVPYAALAAAGPDGRLAVLDLYTRAHTLRWRPFSASERDLMAAWGLDQRSVSRLLRDLAAADLIEVSRADKWSPARICVFDPTTDRPTAAERVAGAAADTSSLEGSSQTTAAAERVAGAVASRAGEDTRAGEPNRTEPEPKRKIDQKTEQEQQREPTALVLARPEQPAKKPKANAIPDEIVAALAKYGYQPNESDRAGIPKLLKSGRTPADVVSVIVWAYESSDHDACWLRGANDKRKNYTRAGTLWRPDNFARYLDAARGETIATETTQVRARASPSRWTDGLRSLMETTEQPQIIEVTEVLHGR